MRSLSGHETLHDETGLAERLQAYYESRAASGNVSPDLDEDLTRELSAAPDSDAILSAAGLRKVSRTYGVYTLIRKSTEGGQNG